jgi:hypothetical protein
VTSHHWEPIEEGDEGYITVECSCLRNDGYPCRHIAFLVDVTHNHFVNRYHRQFICKFKSKVLDDIHKHYSRRGKDRRFIVSKEECASIIQTLRDREFMTTDENAMFWNIDDSICLQRTKTGLIPHQVGSLDKTLEEPRVLAHSQGLMSQEINKPELIPGEIATPRFASMPPQTGNGIGDVIALLRHARNFEGRDHNSDMMLINDTKAKIAACFTRENAAQEMITPKANKKCTWKDPVGKNDKARVCVKIP